MSVMLVIIDNNSSTNGDLCTTDLIEKINYLYLKKTTNFSLEVILRHLPSSNHRR